jgi:glycosyltransferase involved in cell wall biosynthesis
VHIALLSPVWPPAAAANSVVTYVSIMRDHLLKRGHEVSVLAENILYRSDDTMIELSQPTSGTRVWPKLMERLDRRLGHHPFTGRMRADQMRRAAQIVPIDLIETEESFGWSGMIARVTSVPVVTRLHGPQFLKTQADRFVKPNHARHRERAEGRAIKAATNLSAPNSVIMRATCDKYQLAADHGTVIPNPVAIVPEQERWRIDGCERGLILFVGRLDRRKGADTMIAAFARVLTERPSARLEMVGPDCGIEQLDGTVIKFVDYARLTLDPHVFDKIRFTGLLSPSVIRTLRRRAYMTVVASPRENFPYAAVEAMAAGSPLISAHWLGADGVINDGVTGWLTPVGGAERMADRIKWLLAHPEAASTAADAAWRHCKATYAIDEVGDQTIEFYHDAVARHNA